MIIDDDYCQYDTFRIINKADVDAIKQYEADKAAGADKEAELAKWLEQEKFEKEHEESTEESVYTLTYAMRMVQCWSKECAK